MKPVSTQTLIHLCYLPGPFRNELGTLNEDQGVLRQREAEAWRSQVPRPGIPSSSCTALNRKT